LQEQTIIGKRWPIGDAGFIDIEGCDGMQKEKPDFEAIPN
jgi:hypothetical protein